MRGKRNEPTVEPDIFDYCYAAGFIDGEGTITVRCSPNTKNHATAHPSWYASVTVSQVDPRPLQWMQERWGGSVSRANSESSRKANERIAWQWSIVGQQAYRFLEGVEVTLKVKGESARNALRLKDLRSGRGYPNADGSRNRLTGDEVIERQNIRDEALRLNGRAREWEVLP